MTRLRLRLSRRRLFAASVAPAPLAWSADEGPDDLESAIDDARPEILFSHSDFGGAEGFAPLPWYRRPGVLFGAAACLAVVASVGFVLTVRSDDLGRGACRLSRYEHIGGAPGGVAASASSRTAQRPSSKFRPRCPLSGRSRSTYPARPGAPAGAPGGATTATGCCGTGCRGPAARGARSRTLPPAAPAPPAPAAPPPAHHRPPRRLLPRRRLRAPAPAAPPPAPPAAARQPRPAPDPGTSDPGTADPGTTDPGTTDPGTTDPGTTDPGTTDPGTTDPGTTDPGTTDPGTTDPGTTDPGTTDPGTTDPGTGRR